MHTAARSYFTAGLVLTGAGVLAVGPIAARPPSLEIPAAPVAPSVSVSATSIELEAALVELAAAQPALMRAGGPVVTLIEAFQNVTDAALNGIDNVTNDVTATASTITDDIANAVIDILEPVQAKQFAANASTGLIGRIGTGPAQALATLIGAFRDVTDAALAGVDNVVGDVTRTASTITDDIANAVIDILEPAQILNARAVANITRVPTGGRLAGALVTLIAASRNVTDATLAGADNVVGDVTRTASTITDDIANAAINIVAPSRTFSAAAPVTSAPLASVNTLGTTRAVSSIPTVVRRSLTQPAAPARVAVVPTAVHATVQTRQLSAATPAAAERHVASKPTSEKR